MSRESKKEFLEKYYQAKEVAADGLGHKIHAAVDAEKVKYKTKKLLHAVLSFPVLCYGMILGILKIDRHNNNFTHTSHGVE